MQRGKFQSRVECRKELLESCLSSTRALSKSVMLEHEEFVFISARRACLLRRSSLVISRNSSSWCDGKMFPSTRSKTNIKASPESCDPPRKEPLGQVEKLFSCVLIQFTERGKRQSERAKHLAPARSVKRICCVQL